MFGRKRITRLELEVTELKRALRRARVLYDPQTFWILDETISIPRLNERVKGIMYHLDLEEVREPAQTIMRKKEIK